VIAHTAEIAEQARRLVDSLIDCLPTDVNPAEAFEQGGGYFDDLQPGLTKLAGELCTAPVTASAPVTETWTCLLLKKKKRTTQTLVRALGFFFES
jgi:hypothetical protein